jgi:hypothetical protein
MEARDWIAIAAIASSALVSTVSLYFTLHKVPRMEFTLEGNFFGPFAQNERIGEFIVHLANRGGGRHSISSLKLTLRGLVGNTQLDTWDDAQIRVSFPDRLIHEAEVLRPRESINVGAGTSLAMPIAVRIPSANKYVLVQANVQYDRRHRYGVEKIFEVL